MSRARFAAALAVIACVALAGAERARFRLWTTSDEPPHLAAAREWRYGPGMVSNFEHPVLMKVVAGTFLPAEKPTLEIDETRAGRAAIPFVLALLVVATGLLGRAVAGPAAGLAAAAVLAVEPTFRGHGTLVQSDVLLTLFLVAAAFALEKGARGDRRWLVGSGVLYGLAMASKYSAFPFLAVFAAVAVIRVGTKSTRGSSLEGKKGVGQRMPTRGRAPQRAAGARRAPPSSPSKKIFSYLSLSVLSSVAILVAVALATLALVQFLAYAGTTDAAFRRACAPRSRACRRRAPSSPSRRGSRSGSRDTAPASSSCRASRAQVSASITSSAPCAARDRFLYFPVALGVKLTAAAVLASLAALAAAAAGLFRGPRPRRLLAARAALPAALGGAYLLAACVSNVNIGVRHALPAVPLLLVAAAASGRALLATRPRAFRALAAAVVLLAAAESALRIGREISFGNVLVGGPAGVPPILSDSNVDWGQEQGLVFDRVRRGDLGRVAMASLLVDETGATRAGVVGLALRAEADADAVFFSRFLWDLAAAIEKNGDAYSKFVWLRGWLPPLRRGLEARATSVAPFGDAYLLLRLRPATAAPSSAPGSTP